MSPEQGSMKLILQEVQEGEEGVPGCIDMKLYHTAVKTELEKIVRKVSTLREAFSG